MAYLNKTIRNTITGQEIRFIQTAKQTQGQLLEMETTYRSHSKEPAPHYHPAQVEDFIVLEGELTVQMGGQLKILKRGDTLHIPSSKVHSMWNRADSKAVVNWKVRPAMDTEHLLEMVTGLANDGKTNEKGLPNLWQMVLLANKYAHVLRLAKPPFGIQRILFLLLTPFAYLLGYRPTYQKYLD